MPQCSSMVPTLQWRRPGFDPWVGKITWRREWLPTPVFLPGKFHGQRSLVDYTAHGVTKSQTQLKRLTLRGLMAPTPVMALPASQKGDAQLTFKGFPGILATAGLTRSLRAERQQETGCQGQPSGQGASPTPSGAQLYPVSLPTTPSCPIPTNQFDSAQQAGLQFSNYAGLVIQPLHAV